MYNYIETSRVYDAVRFALLCTCICITCICIRIYAYIYYQVSVPRARDISCTTYIYVIIHIYAYLSCVALTVDVCYNQSRTSLIFLDVIDCHVTSIYIHIIIQGVPALLRTRGIDAREFLGNSVVGLSFAEKRAERGSAAGVTLNLNANSVPQVRLDA